MSADVPPLRNVVAMLHVASVARSVAFYAQLGLEVSNTHYEPGGGIDRGDDPVWAWLQSRHGASLMLARADAPVDPAAQAVLFYLYCDDVAAMHAALVAVRAPVGPIAYPFYCPRGEFRLTDPDGYVCMVTHT
ncbi:VOC family protein [Lysobacter sp. CFH 32150]|uniref:VOC family protein n=1 Tax=Lysobacter sp. CFH 32150 TaxID=2927128 RepID=UPI001FA7F8D1|nr:VOC family protein [Lysobacter sp. CFH 32150]MCI4566536.1 hypothetical protein [Lysobacter sp. CFH 32150]